MTIFCHLTRKVLSEISLGRFCLFKSHVRERISFEFWYRDSHLQMIRVPIKAHSFNSWLLYLEEIFWGLIISPITSKLLINLFVLPLNYFSDQRFYKISFGVIFYKISFINRPRRIKSQSRLSYNVISKCRHCLVEA